MVFSAHCTKTKMFPQQMLRVRANRETFRETCFHNNVSATMVPRLRGIEPCWCHLMSGHSPDFAVFLSFLDREYMLPAPAS